MSVLLTRASTSIIGVIADLGRQVLRCFGCIQRERKSLERKKKALGEEDDAHLSIEEEQQKILQFYCNSTVDFSCGEAIIPTRITCKFVGFIPLI